MFNIEETDEYEEIIIFIEEHKDELKSHDILITLDKDDKEIYIYFLTAAGLDTFQDYYIQDIDQFIDILNQFQALQVKYISNYEIQEAQEQEDQKGSNFLKYVKSHQEQKAPGSE